MRFELIIVDITRAGDLAVGVHCGGLAVGAAEGAEIDHPVCPRPRDGMLRTIERTRTDDLATVVHGYGDAEVSRSAAEGAEIDHPLRWRP